MKAERITAGIFIFVIGALMLLVLFSIGSRAKELSDNTKLKIEWEKIYPFEGGMKASQEEKKSFYEYVKSKLKNYTSEKLPGYNKMVEAARRYENALGWNMVSVFDYNAVIKLKDGYLTSYTTSLDVTQDAKAVKNFADFCAEKGIDFMYINFPAKICIYDDKEISGVLDFTNQNADKFLAVLQESCVKNYDFRKLLHQDGLKHHEAFFITDHHWKPETGLWASRHILDILRSDLGWNVEPEILSPERFEYVIYREWFLGSQGKKLTLARVKPDDFTMIYPKFSTSIKFEIPSLGLKASGDFGITYDMKQVESLDYYGRTPYCAYNYGENPLIRAENRLIEDEKRLLVIRDSFCECVISFLLLEVQHVDAINLRYFTGSVRNFIEKEKFDAVIVAYNSALTGTKEFKNLYDFR